jgi:hypothetical protein
VTHYLENELLEIINSFEPDAKKEEALEMFVETVDDCTAKYLSGHPTAAEAFDHALEQHEDYNPCGDIRTRMMLLVDEYVLMKLKYKTLH